MSADDYLAVFPVESGWAVRHAFDSDEEWRPFDPDRDELYSTKEAAILAAHELDRRPWPEGTEYGVRVFE